MHRARALLLVFLLAVPGHAWAQTRIGGFEQPSSGNSPTAPRSSTCSVLGSCPTPEIGPPGGSIVRPGGIAWDGTYLWIGVYFGSRTIYQVDPVSCSVIHTIQAPSDGVGGLAWDGSAVWCLPEQTGRIYRLNPVNGAVLANIPAPSYLEADPNPGDIAWDGQYLWHADYGHNTIYKLDPANGNVLNSFTSPGTACSGIEYTSGVLIISDFFTDIIYEVGTSGGPPFNTCGAPGTHPWGLAMAPDRLWNADGDAVSIYQLTTDVVTRSVASTWGSLKLRYR